MAARYFLDTEFLEGFTKPWFGRPEHFIDLISIGIVDESGRRSYYAISSDADIKRAWHTHDLVANKAYPAGPMFNKVYWVRDNVLKPIFFELVQSEQKLKSPELGDEFFQPEFTLKNLKYLVNKYGKSNQEIAGDIREFVYEPALEAFPKVAAFGGSDEAVRAWLEGEPKFNVPGETIEFYTYYGDYDWVVFCSLFGRMIDLPKGFPMFAYDLHQMRLESGLDKDWKHKHCPDPEGEHNALVDAKWNRRLFKKIRENQLKRAPRPTRLKGILDERAFVVDIAKQAQEKFMEAVRENPTLSEFADRCERMGIPIELKMLRVESKK